MALSPKNVEDIKNLILKKKEKQIKLNNKVWKIAKKELIKGQY